MVLRENFNTGTKKDEAAATECLLASTTNESRLLTAELSLFSTAKFFSSEPTSSLVCLYTPKKTDKISMLMIPEMPSTACNV